MSALDWVTAVAAVAAAGASVLTYWRLRRQGESVGWRLEPGPAGHLLVRTGEGAAYNVDIEFDDAAVAVSWVDSELHQPVVLPGSHVRVATFAPASSDMAPGRVSVSWDRRRLGRKPKREHWTTAIA